jgi:hypothetical protein
MNKLLTLLVLALVTSGCTTRRDYVEAASVEYAGYNKMYLSESDAPPNLRYRQVGSIEVFYAPAKPTAKSVMKQASLGVACEEARRMDANGIINLKFIYDYVLVPSPYSNKSEPQLGYRVTGMAIRRQ